MTWLKIMMGKITVEFHKIIEEIDVVWMVLQDIEDSMIRREEYIYTKKEYR